MDTLVYIRRAAVFAVMDAFDRHVSRDFFASILSNCVNLNELARRLELTNKICHDFEAGELTMESLDAVGEALMKSFEEYRATLLAEAKLISEMPQADDIIH